MNQPKNLPSFPIGVLKISATEGEVIDVNDWVISKTGFERQELVNQSVKKVLPDFQFSKSNDSFLLELVIKEKGRVLTGISQSQNSDPQHYYLFIQEAEPWMRDQDALKDQESRMEAVVNTAVDGIITISSRGLIESVNPAAARLFGYSSPELLGQNISFLMPEPYQSQHDQYIQNYKDTGRKKIIGIGREVAARRKDGSVFPIHLSVSEVKLHDKIIFTGILRDLTAQKEAEEQVRKYAKELERSNRELEDFAYVSSHDLQEPLRKIRAFGDRLFSKEKEKLSDKGADYLQRMINAAERMQDLINDLLSFSRLSTHAKPFEKVDLNQVLKEVLDDLEIAVEQSQAIIKADRLPVIDAEPFQMRQLFQNLIGNALKFRKEDMHPMISITVEEKSAEEEEASIRELIVISVEDNGIGFDERYKDKIFQIFQRLEGRKYEGSGIGLAICKRIATRHGGDIHVDSELGKGTTFQIELPKAHN